MDARAPSFPRIAWMLVLGWIGVIVVSSLVPPATIPRLEIRPANLDRILHALSYAVLAVLLVRALEASGIRSPRAFLLTLGGTLLVGAAVELAQPVVGRSAELGDGIADGVGAAAGLALRALGRSLAWGSV